MHSFWFWIWFNLSRFLFISSFYFSKCCYRNNRSNYFDAKRCSFSFKCFQDITKQTWTWVTDAIIFIMGLAAKAYIEVYLGQYIIQWPLGRPQSEYQTARRYQHLRHDTMRACILCLASVHVSCVDCIINRCVSPFYSSVGWIEKMPWVIKAKFTYVECGNTK